MLVVADTSVFLNLVCVGHGGLLQALFAAVYAPPEVKLEFDRAAGGLSRFAGLVFPQWVIIQAPALPLPALLLNAPLDPGEREAITLAAEIHADAVLIDEVAGRRIATALGLTTYGILGVLLRAKQVGCLDTIDPVLNDLAGRARFHLGAELRRKVLRIAGE